LFTKLIPHKNLSANYMQATYFNIEKCWILRRFVQWRKVQHAVDTAVPVKQTNSHRWSGSEKLAQNISNFKFLRIKTIINPVIQSTEIQNSYCIQTELFGIGDTYQSIYLSLLLQSITLYSSNESMLFFVLRMFLHLPFHNTYISSPNQFLTNVGMLYRTTVNRSSTQVSTYIINNNRHFLTEYNHQQIQT